MEAQKPTAKPAAKKAAAEGSKERISCDCRLFCCRRSPVHFLVRRRKSF